MAYIGKTPITGNFVKLDAISVVNGQASYTMNNGGSAFTDYENVNQFLVSLNGILQAPTDSFTVSGSTLTFASNLATGDVIDFVIVLGNTLDIGTPSDATVTNAKTNFVSTSSSAGLSIKGDGTTDGTLQLNCSQNSHGIKLKSPAHSTSSSYTLTFPGTDPSADKFIKTDGSGNLSFADVSAGITEADMFRLTANLNSNADPVSSNLERVDDATFSKIGTGMSLSSGIYTFPSTGLYHVSSNHEMTWTGTDSINFMMYVSSDSGSNYDLVSANYMYGVNSYVSRFSTMDAFVNVTDASTFRVKFVTSSMSNGYLQGNTDANETYFMFIRLGDSQ